MRPKAQARLVSVGLDEKEPQHTGQITQTRENVTLPPLDIVLMVVEGIWHQIALCRDPSLTKCENREHKTFSSCGKATFRRLASSSDCCGCILRIPGQKSGS